MVRNLTHDLVKALKRRAAAAQAGLLEKWLDRVTSDYADAIISFDEDMAHLWGRLRAPHPQNPLDKQIAATALLRDSIVVTRNTDHYEPTGVRLLHPFV
jgi:predicted nucleic acid-binding protein